MFKAAYPNESQYTGKNRAYENIIKSPSYYRMTSVACPKNWEGKKKKEKKGVILRGQSRLVFNRGQKNYPYLSERPFSTFKLQK